MRNILFPRQCYSLTYIFWAFIMQRKAAVNRSKLCAINLLIPQCPTLKRVFQYSILVEQIMTFVLLILVHYHHLYHALV